MSSTLDALIHLQAVERQHRDVLRRLENRRRRIRQQHKRIQQLDEQVHALDDEIKRRQAEADRMDLDIQSRNNEVAKLRAQLNTVKTNREYSALLTEIESVKREKDELEEAIIQNMGQVETIEASIAESKEKAKEIEGRLKGKRKELDGQLKALDGEIGVREQKREALAVRVPANVMGLYNRIMHSKMTRAIVNVRNGSCGGCFAHIPLQKVADIRIAEKIYTCDHCGRMLYYSDKEEN